MRRRKNRKEPPLYGKSRTRLSNVAVVKLHRRKGLRTNEVGYSTVETRDRSSFYLGDAIGREVFGDLPNRRGPVYYRLTVERLPLNAKTHRAFESRESGVCSAHAYGEEPGCRLCYPDRKQRRKRSR